MATKEFPLALVIKAVDRATAPLRAINAQITKATTPARKLSNSLRALGDEAGVPRLVSSFGAVGKAAGGVGDAVRGLGGTILGMVGGALFGGYGLYSLAKGAMDAGDSLGEISQRVGLGVDAFAQLQFAAAQADVSADGFGAAMDQLNKRLGEAKAGGGPMLSFLDKVSPTLARQVKSAKGTEQAFGLLTSAFEKVTDPAKRAALAAAVFGKSGLQMGQFLGQGSKAIAEQRRRYLELAGSQEALAAGAGGMDNALREAETAFLGLRNATMVALFPALTKLAGAVSSFLARNRDGLQRWATATGDAITKWVESGGLERLAASLQKLAEKGAALVEKLGGLEGVAKLVAIALGAQLAGSVVGLVASLGQATFAVGAFVAKLAGPGIAYIASWISYLWMMRASIIASLVPSLTAATASVWSFTAALFANPITWVVAAIAALAVAVYLIYKNWDPIAAYFTKLWGQISYLAQEAWGGLKDFFVELWDGITGTFMSAWETIKPIVDKIMGVLKFTPIGMAFKGGEFLAETFFGSEEARPTLGAATAAPLAGPLKSEARVQVDFANLPRGARVTPEKDNTAALDYSLGYSMVGG